MLKLYWNEEIKDCDHCAISWICDSRIILINCSTGTGTYQIKGHEPEYKLVKATRDNLKIGSDVKMFQYENTENKITAIGKDNALVEIDCLNEKMFKIESLRVKQVRTTEVLRWKIYVLYCGWFYFCSCVRSGNTYTERL